MDPLLIEEFKREYPDYTGENLDHHGVSMAPDDSGDMQVDHGHPAVMLLRANQLLLGVHDHELLQGPWVRLSAPTFHTACSVIRSGIFGEPGNLQC